MTRTLTMRTRMTQIRARLRRTPFRRTTMSPARRRLARVQATPPASDKSARGLQDTTAADGLGVACTRVLDRVKRALGLLPGGAATQFEPCRDVSFGGVLCALPALAENQPFRHLDQCFQSLGGYYTTLQVMTLLSFMALCRIKTVEQLQYHPPGELGKLLGLDRVPEVRLSAAQAHGP